VARINIEENLWGDARFLKLCIALGDELRAVGAVVMAWKTAQRFWCPDRKPIPTSDFQTAGLPKALIDVGLAEETPEGIRMRGSEEHFSWWFQRQEAGRKGGLATAERKLATAERPISGVEQIVPSSSSSYSYSLSLSKNKELKALAVARPQPEGIGRFVAEYVKAWQRRYGDKTRPDLGGKVQGQIKAFMKDRDVDRAVQLIQVYFQMDDKWFVTKCHDFGTFIENLDKVGLALDTGNDPSGVNWSEVFK
jgi:hypothetical protein